MLHREKWGRAWEELKKGKHNQNIKHELFLINNGKKVSLHGQNREKNTVKPRTKMSTLICLTIWEGAQTEGRQEHARGEGLEESKPLPAGTDHQLTSHP